jgi:hypothetical protein
MMAVAMPVVESGIARLPNASVELAAFGVVHSVAVLIESPVIMLFGASVALVEDRYSYRLVRRFTVHLMLILTAVSAVSYFTPLRGVILFSILGLPEETAAAARPGLQIMLLWPALIAWRRFYQGVLVRHGLGRYVTYATAFRLLTAAATVVVGVWLGALSGASVGSLALLLAVAAEALAVTWWALPIVRANVKDSESSSPEGTRTYAGLYRFYAPLAATEVMRTLSGPLVVAGIARSALPGLSLAAWPVSFGLARLVSVGAIPLQEVSIKTLADGLLRARLVRFTWALGASLSVLLALVVFTPLAHTYFSGVIQIPAEVEPPAIIGAQILVLYPLLLAVRSHYRGQLIEGDETRYVQFAMGANVASLLLVLAVGAWLSQVPGILLAAAATILAGIVEVGVLHLGSRLSERATVCTSTT